MKRRADGEGRIYRPTYKDKATGERRQLAVWWVQYTDPRRPKGKEQVRESSGCEERKVAARLLRERLDDLAKGRPTGPDIERTTVADLHEMIANDYRKNGRRTLGRIEECWQHLKGFFGEAEKVIAIDEARIDAYAVHRQCEGAKNATINRELACLRRMFRLGARARRVGRRPDVTLLRENNRRKGFMEAGEVTAIVDNLPADLKPVAEVAYITGWRVASEILTREWKHVDFEAGFLRLEPGESKTDEPRMFPFTPELREVLGRERERTTAIEQARGRIIPWVFHRSGEPIRTFRRAWLTACAKAGVPGKIPHDFRRSAVRNLERAGVPRSAAMAMVGHRTESIYRRYAIVDTAMMRDAAVKLGQFHEAQKNAPARPKVVAMKTGTGKP